MICLKCTKRDVEKCQADLSSDLGFAVALTHTQATVWRYKPTTLSSESSKPLVINLPHGSNNVRHPLPLGLLSQGSGSRELALLVVMPSSGKVTYWENVLSAGHTDMTRQKQQGFQGMVNGMLLGETVTRLVEAEPDGFILTLSTGRLVHLTVRDSQGKPLVDTQYLRGNSTSSTGILGGLKSVLSGGGWKRNIAAVKSGQFYGRTHRACVVATTKGLFQVWDTIRNSPCSLTFEVDVKDEICRAVGKIHPEVATLDENSFSVLDFAIFPSKHPRTRELSSQRILVLTAHASSMATRYVLLDLMIQDGSVEIDVVHPISCYSEPLRAGNQEKPLLLLPEPAQTAFVVFPRSITLVSLAKIESSPSSQLQMESHSLPDPFQDTLYFRADSDYSVAGCCSEITDRGSNNASCSLLIHGFGLVQVAVLPIKEGQSALGRSAVTAKSKIEQAIFFGNMPHNLLDFTGRTEIIFNSEEIETAVLEINESIMKCTSDYIPSILPSMDQQLQIRSNALADLIKYLQRHRHPLKQVSRWELLWSAERLAAARAIWKSYTSSLRLKSKNDTSLLAELLDMLNEQHKTENEPERAETDVVRHYFINDLWRLELVVPWAQQAVEELHKEGIKDTARRAALISQANDIQISAMEAAFNFRTANAAIYGIRDDLIEDGILQGSYEGLPEIWTSIPETVAKVKALADLSCETAIRHADSEELDLQTLLKLAEDYPRLIHICCQVYEERSRWLKSRPDAQRRAEGESLVQTYLQVRKELLVKTVDLELPDQGAELAEKYMDMQALVDILFQDTEKSTLRLTQPGVSDSEGEECLARVDMNRQRMESYFTTFGTAWANAFFSKQVAEGCLSELFENPQKRSAQLTQYLRSKPEYTKLSWINEVLGESNYAKAADDLLAAQKQESNLWNKRIELSMAKLALLAAEEKEQVQGEGRKKMSRQADRRVEIIAIQDNLLKYVRPALRGALDATAELEIAMDQFCRHFIEGRPALLDTMEENFKKLLARQVLDTDELVDILTLIDIEPEYPDDEGFADKRFYSALLLLKLSGFERTGPRRKERVEKSIWRRCMIQDDWEAINRTELKDDTEVGLEAGATALFRTLKAAFQNGWFFPPLSFHSFIHPFIR